MSTSCEPRTFPVVSRNSNVTATGEGFMSFPLASVALRPVAVASMRDAVVPIAKVVTSIATGSPDQCFGFLEEAVLLLQLAERLTREPIGILVERLDLGELMPTSTSLGQFWRAR